MCDSANSPTSDRPTFNATTGLSPRHSTDRVVRARGRRRHPRCAGRSPSSRRPRRGSRARRQSPTSAVFPRPDAEPQAQALAAGEKAHREVHASTARDDRGRTALEPGHVRHEVGHHAVDRVHEPGGVRSEHAHAVASWRSPRPRPGGCRPPAVSAKPPAHTTAARTPPAPQSSSADGTASAGTTSTARSTGAPMAAPTRDRRVPRSPACVGFTRCSSPGNPSNERTIALPALPGVALAPTIAIDFGQNSDRSPSVIFRY